VVATFLAGKIRVCFLKFEFICDVWNEFLCKFYVAVIFFAFVGVV